MVIDVDPPSWEPWSLDSFECQVFEIELLNHFLIVRYLVFSFHNFGI
jgi:hypothetical protein